MSAHSFTEEQIVGIESQFGLSFPIAYREVLLEYPLRSISYELIGAVRQSMPDAGITEDDAVEDLVEINETFREAGTGWEFSWRDNFWWIGNDGSGGFFFIDCSDSDSPVFYFDHEVRAMDFTDKERLKPRSIEDYVSNQLAFEAECDAERQTLAEKIASRRWWQFWVPKEMPARLKED